MTQLDRRKEIRNLEEEIESLRQQLASALAACRLKDEALKRWKFDSLNMPLSEFEVILREAMRSTK